jgi:hypothetical protein
MYQIETTGKIQPGLNRNDVANNIRTLCKYEEEAIQQIFSGRPFVFKSGVDLATAQRYKNALDKTGIVCRISRQEPRPDAVASAKPKLKMVTCPKCGKEQPEGIYCIACQIVMSKYNPDHSVQQPSTYVPPVLPEAAVEKTGGSPLFKIILACLLVIGLGTGLYVFKPFASAKGDINKETGSYANHRYGFALSFPDTWNVYTIEEVITCPTILREYADNYFLFISPTNPDHCALVVNISGITLDGFKSEGWEGHVKSTSERHPVSYQSVDQINGLTVYRVGYDIASSYREDAYFEANGTLIQIYFYVRRSHDAAERVVEMRNLLDSNLTAI